MRVRVPPSAPKFSSRFSNLRPDRKFGRKFLAAIKSYRASPVRHWFVILDTDSGILHIKPFIATKNQVSRGSAWIAWIGANGARVKKLADYGARREPLVSIVA